MTNWIATHPSVLAAAAALALLWLAEGLFPIFAHVRARGFHGVRNLTLGLINGGVRATFFPAALVVVAETTRHFDTGLLRMAPLPAWTVAVLGVLLLDLAGYAVHVASHHCPFLWRFHAVHHHDDAIDSTTAFRFHLGDVLLGALATLLVVALLGLRVEHVLLYEVLLIPVSIFHHANVRLSPRIDRILNWVIVTPRMHWVHHSQWVAETDSNYSPIFSSWDRLFGTFSFRSDPTTIQFGLEGYTEADSASLLGCLATPLQPVKSGPGRDTRRHPESAVVHVRPLDRQAETSSARECGDHAPEPVSTASQPAAHAKLS